MLSGSAVVQYEIVVKGLFQFANVYKARDIETNDFVAIKKVRYLSSEVSGFYNVAYIFGHFSSRKCVHFPE